VNRTATTARDGESLFPMNAGAHRGMPRLLAPGKLSDYSQVMDADLVQQVRRFNRLVTKRIGALETGYLRRGRPLGEARMLYEIGLDGGEVRALRGKLGLDSGYVSRLLRSLEEQGLVQVQGDLADGRVRRASLTRKGRAEFKAYDQGSDALAASILAPLSVTQRRRLVTAMSEVEHLIRLAAVDIRIEAPGSRDARWCLEAYFNELAVRFETGFDAKKSISAREEEMTPPAGYFLVARLDDKPAGCGALKVKEANIGEIKRMWTAPFARGLGVARRVLDALEAKAGEVGIRTLRLETNKALHEAQALYRGSGYREVEPFNDEPYAHHWFEKFLSDPSF
jgi:DNA-binding MarR family transcriptional regulator/GNAT superfamily N-acetyltransferase